jgi:hypothetical protein
MGAQLMGYNRATIEITRPGSRSGPDDILTMVAATPAVNLNM